MKGLVTNNFYSMQDNIKMALFLSVVLAFVPFFLKNSSYSSMIIAMQIFIYIVNIGTSLQVDESSKWNRWEITLPVRRYTIIKAKYISFMALILLGLLTSVLTPFLLSLRGIAIDNKMLIHGYTYGLSLAISTAAFIYPLLLKFGAEKSELIIIVASGLSFVLRIIVSILLNLTVGNINFNDNLVGILTTIISVFLFALSYQISVWLQSNKEF